MAPDKVRAAWPAFATTDFEGLDRVRYNPNCGWVDAADSLEAVRQHVVNAGATLVVGKVTTLLFDTAGGCTGVRLGNGDELNGTVVLCTGARTAALLAESAPERKEIHAAHRLAATGAVSFTLKAEGDQKDKFRGIPVLKNTLPSVKGESMSMTPDGTLKFNCDMAFLYNQFHTPTGTTMSLAPTDPHLTEWTTEEHIPRHLKNRAYKTLKGLYGDEMEGRTIDKYRICCVRPPPGTRRRLNTISSSPPTRNAGISSSRPAAPSTAGSSFPSSASTSSRCCTASWSPSTPPSGAGTARLAARWPTRRIAPRATSVNGSGRMRSSRHPSACLRTGGKWFAYMAKPTSPCSAGV